MKPLKLAVEGGPRVRNKPMPYRMQFGKDELNSVVKVFEDSWATEKDFGYQGKYEKLYTDKFCEMHGGGYADAVSSGSAAVLVALQSLDIPTGSDIVVSPITDPGSVSPPLLSDMNIIISDSQPDSFNMGPKEFVDSITTNTKCLIVTHAGGNPCEIEAIVDIAKRHDIYVIEDCSQSHGARYNGGMVGCFGDIAVFSTMYSKNHSTGGCGGITFTKREDIYWRMRGLADRGKPFNSQDYNPKDPSAHLFPAMNYNLDELSCAIGLSTLKKLRMTIEKRNTIISQINRLLKDSNVVTPIEIPNTAVPSPFFHTLIVDESKLRVSKVEFARAIMAEGIDLNPNYNYVVSEWPWIKPHIRSENKTYNAVSIKNRSFNVLLNERYGREEVNDIVTSILKVEAAYSV